MRAVGWSVACNPERLPPWKRKAEAPNLPLTTRPKRES
jgi:hypothetical protein